MEYKDLSRRGLIKMNGDYDKTNDNKLKEFMNNSSTAYEEIRPYEQIAERLDDLTEAVEEKGGVVSDAIMGRVNHVFDSIITSMSEEITRCESVIEEQEDDESFPDETDEEIAD